MAGIALGVNSNQRVYRPELNASLTPAEYEQYWAEQLSGGIVRGVQGQQAQLATSPSALILRQAGGAGSPGGGGSFIDTGSPGGWQQRSEWEQQQALQALRAQDDLAKAQHERQVGGQLTLQRDASSAQAAREAAARAAETAMFERQQIATQQAEGRRLADVEGLLNKVGSAQIDPGSFQASADAADEAAFARAKDRAGWTARSAVAGLQDAMAGRGMGQSGVRDSGAANIINQAAGQLGDVNVQQLANRAASNRQWASERLNAGLTQRAQNLGFAQSALAGLNGVRAY